VTPKPADNVPYFEMEITQEMKALFRKHASAGLSLARLLLQPNRHVHARIRASQNHLRVAKSLQYRGKCYSSRFVALRHVGAGGVLQDVEQGAAVRRTPAFLSRQRISERNCGIETDAHLSNAMRSSTPPARAMELMSSGWLKLLLWSNRALYRSSSTYLRNKARSCPAF